MAKKTDAIEPPSLKFIGSFAFDQRLAPYDIEGSLAHTAMLARKRIIPAKAAKKISRALISIFEDINRGWKLPPHEDVHFALETELIRRAGPAGKMVHTGRSRNDQVITDIYLYLRDNYQLIVKGIKRVQRAILSVAIANKTVVMPGFTHLQHAQPILFSHHILAYAWMLERDKGRIQDALKRSNYLPLGSAALAGTSFPIDRAYVAKLLKFKNLSENSIDATASRDMLIEFVSASAICLSHLSRFAEEMILWSSSEFSFIQLAEEFTSGSSIMPQKRNPDVPEIVRAETGRVNGSLIALLTIVKGLPLAYNRDLQEDKPPLFDAVDTTVGCLTVMAPMIQSMKVNEARLRQACEEGFLSATELADFLARKGVPFRTAHGVVRDLVRTCQTEGLRFDQLTTADLKKFHPKFNSEALNLLMPEKVVQAKKSYGGTSPASVEKQIKLLTRLCR